MLIEPGINELLEKVDSRYTLVVEVAKRARQLYQGAIPLIECGSENPVTIAAYEVLADKVTYSKTKIGIK